MAFERNTLQQNRYTWTKMRFKMCPWKMLLKNKDVPFCFPLDFFGILIILVFWGKRNLIDSNLTIYESLIDVQKNRMKTYYNHYTEGHRNVNNWGYKWFFIKSWSAWKRFSTGVDFHDQKFETLLWRKTDSFYSLRWRGGLWLTRFTCVWQMAVLWQQLRPRFCRNVKI